jgi:hypothetical protein
LGIREDIPRATDAQRASLLGHLFIAGHISQKDYEAGIDYATKILDYLKTIDAPFPYGGDISDFSDETCLARKLAMAEARSVLGRAGRRASSVVDRVAVYGEQIAPEEIPLLCDGLAALSRK